MIRPKDKIWMRNEKDIAEIETERAELAEIRRNLEERERQVKVKEEIFAEMDEKIDNFMGRKYAFFPKTKTITKSITRVTETVVKKKNKKLVFVLIKNDKKQKRKRKKKKKQKRKKKRNREEERNPRPRKRRKIKRKIVDDIIEISDEEEEEEEEQIQTGCAEDPYHPGQKDQEEEDEVDSSDDEFVEKSDYFEVNGNYVSSEMYFLPEVKMENKQTRNNSGEGSLNVNPSSYPPDEWM